MPKKSKKHKIFVYGTLRPTIKGEYIPYTHTLRGYTMYATRSYPFIKHGTGVVNGNIIEVDDDGLIEADLYESVDSGLYVREQATAYDASSQPIPVFVYIAGPRFDYPVIESGDWKTYTGL